MKNLALLVLRGTGGVLLAGHGAQKLFGWFEGPGIEGTTGMMQHMGFRQARPWAWLAALAEFGGGTLTALGFLNPLGPMGILSAMGMATAKAHWGKPIWASKGGAELPVTNAAIATAIALAGPGDWSLDHVLGIRLPRWVLLPAFALTAGGVAAGVLLSRQPQQTAEQPAAQEPAQPEQQAVQPDMPDGNEPDTGQDMPELTLG